MKPILTFQVDPVVPARLKVLRELAYNICWSWEHDTIALFRRLDRDLWEETYHNPVLLLGRLPQERLEEVAHDDAFLAHLDRLASDLQQYLQSPSTWYLRTFGSSKRPLVAYFSMEFGLTESLPIYSGGLGILAGDHLKSASDLGVPLVAVGLLYQKGYFRQYLNNEGWQQELYPVNDFYTMPVVPLRDAKGDPLHVTVDLAGRPLTARLWHVQVGRITLVLLDTNIPENPDDLKGVSGELYGGDGEVRIRQEILLGLGGLRALKLLGLKPHVYHMNEGHSAFLALERIRWNMKEHGMSFGEARELVTAGTLFTTHTPVPAGIDVFPANLMERHFGPFRSELGLSSEAFLDLGRIRTGDPSEPFNMAALAIRTSCFVNGVSRLHGHVARRMWPALWPGVPEEEMPITHITNGIHAGSWISDDMRSLYDRYLGPRWAEEPGDARRWRRAEQIPGEELWRTHERRRERLVAFARRRLAAQLRRRGTGAGSLAEAENVLDPEALTIGFARRFATYKRATLLLSDPTRLSGILNAPGRPVQVIFAGKAHPKDGPGKDLIREVVQLAGRPEFRHRVVFLEDYDSVVSRYLVQGADVWLNTPRRYKEASGTSGMKAAFNGALNLSIPDGWWDEAASPRTGWAIGRGEDYDDPAYGDRVESSMLYDLLEREVVPLFYTRSSDGLPKGWIGLMKSAMGELCPVFNTNRMVQQYVTEAYHVARDRAARLEADDFRRARSLAAWRDKIRAAWHQVQVVDVTAELPHDVQVGTRVELKAIIDPGPFLAGELAVQAWVGEVDERLEISGGRAVGLTCDEEAAGPRLIFGGSIECVQSGRRGLTVRVLPYHPDQPGPFSGAPVVWAQPS